jgi:hypothetical protein
VAKWKDLLLCPSPEVPRPGVTSVPSLGVTSAPKDYYTYVDGGETVTVSF